MDDTCTSTEILSTDELPEQRKAIANVLWLVKEENNMIEYFKKFSNLYRLQRIIAYCLRFRKNCLKSRTKTVGVLTLTELQNALIIIIKIVQNEAFSDEIKLLKENKFYDTSLKNNRVYP